MIKEELSFYYKNLILNAVNFGINSVTPDLCITEKIKSYKNTIIINNYSIDLSKFKKINVISIGKASIKMLQSFKKIVKPDSIFLVSNEEFNPEKHQNITYIKSNHPIPDKNSFIAGKKIFEFIKNIDKGDITFFLISGGGSALIEDSLVPMEDIQKTNEILIKCGANIHEINCIRKHLSNIKGGKILRKIKGVVISLIISDVVGDSLDTIASGVTYYDTSTFDDAKKILFKYKIYNNIPFSVRELIEKGIKSEIEETLKKDEFHNLNVKNFIIANNYIACKNIKKYLRNNKINTFYFGSRVQGEAREIGKFFGGLAIEADLNRLDIKRPYAFISGGETTVVVKGNGKGGRNQELVLSAVPFLNNRNVIFISIGTDGIDGNTNAAGAICSGITMTKAVKLGLDYESFLNNNDSFTFFKELNDLIILGKTGTNVADIQILLIF